MKPLMEKGRRLTLDPSDPKLIKIEGTLELCGELDIDPESVSIVMSLPRPYGYPFTIDRPRIYVES